MCKHAYVYAFVCVCVCVFVCVSVSNCVLLSVCFFDGGVGKESRESGLLSRQFCSACAPGRARVEGHGGFPWQPGEGSTQCKGVAGELGRSFPITDPVGA